MLAYVLFLAMQVLKNVVIEHDGMSFILHSHFGSSIRHARAAGLRSEFLAAVSGHIGRALRWSSWRMRAKRGPMLAVPR